MPQPRRRSVALRLVVTALWALCAGAALADAPTERELKAAFLFHFPSYVEWPPHAFGGPGEPLVIAILGEDPFGPVLDELVSGRSVQGHPLRVRRLARLSDMEDVHVLYLGYSDPLDVRFACDTLRDHPVLTVTDGERLAEQGAMINLRLRDRKVRFDVNVEAADRAGLKLSSQLLKLARIVPASASESAP